MKWEHNLDYTPFLENSVSCPLTLSAPALTATQLEIEQEKYKLPRKGKLIDDMIA